MFEPHHVTHGFASNSTQPLRYEPLVIHSSPYIFIPFILNLVSIMLELLPCSKSNRHDPLFPFN